MLAGNFHQEQGSHKFSSTQARIRPVILLIAIHSEPQRHGLQQQLPSVAPMLQQSIAVQLHLAEFRNQTGTRNKNKKACYVFCSKLFFIYNSLMVGRGGLEPTTKGL